MTQKNEKSTSKKAVSKAPVPRKKKTTVEEQGAPVVDERATKAKETGVTPGLEIKAEIPKKKTTRTRKKTVLPEGPATETTAAVKEKPEKKTKARVKKEVHAAAVPPAPAAEVPTKKEEVPAPPKTEQKIPKEKHPAPMPAKPAVPHVPPAPAKTQAPPVVAPPAPKREAPAPGVEAPSVSAPAAVPAAPAKVAEPKVIKGEIKINELTTVRDLAEKMGQKPGELLKKLLSMGSLATINQKIDADTASLLAHEFGYEVKFQSFYSEEVLLDKEDDPSMLKPRPPVVTIMGHVDHGKTSLLDSIRESRVAEGEAGGITQHIGAYKVKTPKGEIAFLDTPGHEAFTAMRSRGAQATDLVVLVVSAADGVMPQTVEAIDHARAAGVPIIVAVNKVDLPTANPAQTKQELTKYSLVPEEWGGDTIMVDVSAKKRINIDQLLEMILLKAEIMELKSNPDRLSRGVVIEAKLDSKRGPVATVLIQKGTLRVGDNFVVGTMYGKVRAMIDEHGQRLPAAGPSTPVEILGISAPPQAGDQFIVVADERIAREIAQTRQAKAREEAFRPRHHLSLEDVSSGKAKELRLILKADVQGSLGALSDSLERLSTTEIALKIIHSGAGSITESDVTLAAASDALIIGFNIKPDASVEKLAEAEGVSIRVYRIIYELIADVKAAMEGLLEPQVKETRLGIVQVKQVFKVSKVGTIAGCTVTEGKIQRGNKVRLLRDNVIIYEGNISSLKRFKEDAREVEKGYECGVGLENFSDIKPGDVLEVFSQEKVARKL